MTFSLWEIWETLSSGFLCVLWFSCSVCLGPARDGVISWLGGASSFAIAGRHSCTPEFYHPQATGRSKDQRTDRTLADRLSTCRINNRPEPHPAALGRLPSLHAPLCISARTLSSETDPQTNAAGPQWFLWTRHSQSPAPDPLTVLLSVDLLSINPCEPTSSVSPCSVKYSSWLLKRLSL